MTVSVGDDPQAVRGRQEPWASPGALFPYLCMAVSFVICVFFAFYYQDVDIEPHEHTRAAIALLHGQGLANPYITPTGPTAHVSPLFAFINAGIYSIFGEYTGPARVAVSVIYSIIYVLNIWLALRISVRLGVGRLMTNVVMFIVSIIPFYHYYGVILFRQWDQPYACLMLTATLHLFLRGLEDRRPGYGQPLLMAVLAGCSVVMTPVIAPTCFFAMAWMAWKKRHGDLRQYFVRITLATMVIFAVFIVPWGVRNYYALGKFIITRSNFNIELSTGNNDAAEGRVVDPRQIHPSVWPEAGRRVAEIGEVAYAAQEGEVARAWVWEHKARFVWLTVKRFYYYFIPSLPLDTMMADTPLAGMAAMWIMFACFGVARAAALALTVVWRRHMALWWNFAVLPMAPFFITYVHYRYTFATFFVSACLIGAMADLWLKKRAGAA